VTTALAAGDVRIDFTDERYTLVDTAFLARVPDMSVRNWQARGMFTVGHKHPASGRWFFSLCDALRLAVMHDLCVRPGLDFGPRKASVIADFVIDAAMKNLAEPDDGYRRNLNVLVAWDEAGEMLVTTADIKHPGSYYPPVNNDEYAPLRRSIIAIPASAMLIDLGLRTEQLTHRNARAEAPNHV